MPPNTDTSVTDEMIEAGARAAVDQLYYKSNAWERCLDNDDQRNDWRNAAKFAYLAMEAARQPIEAPSDIGLVERFGLLARLGKHADALEGDPRAALWVSDIREARSTLIAKQAEIDELRNIVGWCQRRLDPRQQKFVDEIMSKALGTHNQSDGINSSGDR